MTKLSYFICMLTLLMAALIMGCSSSTGQNPSTPQVTQNNLSGDSVRNGNSHVPWGFYEISIDRETLEASVIPLRSAEFNANVTQFMQPPVSPTNRISVSIDGGASDIPNGLFAVDITLHHPFPGLSQYSGFDVRGIFMGNGSLSSTHYTGLTYASSDDARLLNADGWTRWWNPTEFTTLNTIFGYTKGSMSSPGFSATATLNPYKYFCDGLDKDAKMQVDPASRGFFKMSSSNSRRYMIQFTLNGGAPDVKFNYAVDASWDSPNPAGAPNYDVDDFALSANCQEAYQISVGDAGSTAWFVDGANNGGDLSLDIKIYDWQAPTNPVGIKGEVSAIWVESSALMSAPVDVLSGATFYPDGPTSSVFHVEIADVHPTGLTNQTIMVAVESKAPADYAPNLPGISGFAFPAQPLAAFMFWDAPILTEEPVAIPKPTGLDNCAAAGVVKIFWDPVVWPTLAGYNVFRKLSVDSGYNFSSPLNPSPIADTFYIDTAVQMDGTTYDYVVTAVDTDTTQSNPSDPTSATPEYIIPTGFTDMDNPDKTMGSVGVANYINAQAVLSGKIALTWDWGPYFVWGDMNGTAGNTINLGSGGQAPNVTVDPEGNAHVVWTNTYTNNRIYYYAEVTPDNNILHQTTLHSFNNPSDGWESESCIAVTPDGEVHIVLSSYDGAYDLIYMHGQPGNFSSPEVLTHDVYSMIYVIRPEMAADRFGNLHLVWIGPGMGYVDYMKRDTTGTWSTPVHANASISGGLWHGFPDLAVDYEGTAHIAWNVITNGGAYETAYVNNRTGTFLGQVIPGSDSSGNFTGVSADRDGNAYVSWWNSSDARVRVAMYDRSRNLIKVSPVNDNQPYQGSWTTMTGIVDPCYASDTGVIAYWKNFPNSPPPVYSRLRTDH